ncbi:hypothetical protein BDA96_02G106200 [Sorghum bicolor]|uniref:Uncharacterized protein n=1 Tax=Sorghum bicolor TaxID=4558 RepID=A0A921RNV4_SORBI|nr:hypothetical protein BDA96_02G106200 [Sorghum bicolor]
MMCIADSTNNLASTTGIILWPAGALALIVVGHPMVAATSMSTSSPCEPAGRLNHVRQMEKA